MRLAAPKYVKAPAAVWLLFFCACLYIVVSRFSTTVDLSYFLPAAGNAEQQILIDRLGQGAGSQLWFIVLPGGFSAEPERISEQFASVLRDSGLFRSVANGQEGINADSMPAVIFTNRYLLTDQDFSSAGFAKAVRDLIPDLLLAPDSATEEWLTADPYLASVAVLEQMSATMVPDALTWIAADGTSYLIAESIAPAYEISVQLDILELVRSTAEQFAVVPEMYGVGAYGAMLQQTIEAEARLRTLLASFAIIVMLLLVYRSLSLVLISAVPLLLGAVAALAAVTAIFGTVHGITLAFGFTLFGVAIDFPLHIFSHSRGGRSALPNIWPTLRLGAASTVLAYCAVAAAGSLGLAQLGLFSAVGVVVALLASVSLVPWLLTFVSVAHEPVQGGVANAYSLSHRAWFPALLLAMIAITVMVLGQSRAIWSDDLSTLTPLPAETIARDRVLRQQFGAPDIRYLILLQSADKEQVLQQTERLATDLRNGKLMAGVQAVTDLVPSAERQRRRRTSAEFFVRESAVITAQEFGLVDNAFAAFFTAVEALRSGQPDVSEFSYRDTSFAASVDSGLYQQNNVWFSVLLPGQIDSIPALNDYLQSVAGDAVLVDLKAASLSLVSDYRLRILLMLAVAAFASFLLLTFFLGPGARLYWVLGGLVATFLCTLSINLLLFDAISLFNLIALVLVVGLSLDYLLFSSRACDVRVVSSDYADSRHAITASMLSTAAAFAVLAMSDVPILAGLGTTVLSGVLVAYLIASFGIRRDT